MSLEQCPKMAQTCPHKSIGCDGPDGDQCHYVTTTLGTSVTALSQLRSTVLARDERLNELIEGVLRRSSHQVAERMAAALRKPVARDE